jgi:peptide/nickel transport system substrate-binding protein
MYIGAPSPEGRRGCLCLIIYIKSISINFSFLKPSNWPKIAQVLNFKEKLIFFLLLILMTGGLVFWLISLFLNFTKPVARFGGHYTEGLAGQPAYINPLLSQTSEADADLVQLIYSGLLKYDDKGALVNDLAESYQISEDQKTYTVNLKKNAKWHDGVNLTAQDIVFTINTLENPAYKSPLRYNWQNIEVAQVDDYTVVFTLKTPYFGFLDSLTVGILPKHIWENIAPEKFALADFNLQPVGSGPYKFFDFQKDSSGNILSYDLQNAADHYQGKPYISKITFNFYSGEDALLDAYNKKEVMGMGSLSPEKIGSLKSSKSTKIHQINIPRYFSIFLNISKSVPLADSKVREALSHATNREEIIKRVLNGRGVDIYSPLLPQMEGFSPDDKKHEYNLNEANKILDESGWEMKSDGIREKKGEKLTFEMFTTDWPELALTADILREQWKAAGADIKINVLTVSDLQQNYIRPREYDSLLFGQAISFDPDLYYFWHSSQKRDPGLNLSSFDNAKADALLEEIRTSLAKFDRIKKLKELQDIMANENPAIFLYSPFYIYPVSSKLKGIESQNLNSPSWRFANVNKWYINTKRVRK